MGASQRAKLPTEVIPASSGTEDEAVVFQGQTSHEEQRAAFEEWKASQACNFENLPSKRLDLGLENQENT